MTAGDRAPSGRNDVIVVGAGPAGLAAAVALAEAGRSVRVIARGNGSTHWAPGTVDILARAGGEPVERPLDALDRLPARHPYRLLGGDTLRRAVDAFQRFAGGAGLAYEGSLDSSRGQVTALGTIRRTGLVPEPSARPLTGRVTVVGFAGFRDFSAPMCARGLAEAGHHARAHTVELPDWSHKRHFFATDLARAIDDERYRARLADHIGPATRGADTVVVPAVLGLATGHAAWAELERRLGVPLVEAALVPPSVPGIRLWSAWLARLRELGVRVQLGFPATGLRVEDGRVTAVISEGAARPIVNHCTEVVLATGGVAGKGIVMDRHGALTEVVAGLPVRGFEHRLHAFGQRFLDDHPISAAGVVVDDELRPVDDDGEVVVHGVRCIGGLLADHDPLAEGSREGVALATATRVAELLSPASV